MNLGVDYWKWTLALLLEQEICPMGTIYRQGEIVNLYLKKIVNFSSNLSGSKSKFSDRAPPPTSKSYFDQVGFYFFSQNVWWFSVAVGRFKKKDIGNKSFDYI